MPVFVPLLAMALLLVKVVDFLRFIRGRDTNGWMTQLAVWVAGVLVTLLVAHTNWAGAILVGTIALSKLSFWSLVFYGLTIGSTASVAKDVIKAIDGTQSAAAPPLVGAPAAHTHD